MLGMRVCTYRHEGVRGVGVVLGGLQAPTGVAPLTPILGERLSAHQPMIDLITHWQEWRALVQAGLPALRPLPWSQIELDAPVPRPGKTLAIGLNYLEHVQESIVGETRQPPAHQIWFPKLANAIHPPHAPIVLPRISNMSDYEAELVVVIGKRCRHVQAHEAASVIFGYCVGNDVSVRDIQKRSSQWTLGKSFDTHAPIGPWITTADEVANAQALQLRCWVNGELRQHSNTRLMIHDIGAQIAQLTQVMTLEPGDLIFTGTCAGVGAAFDPPRFLRAGDRVRIEIAQLGAIEAGCIDED